MAVAVVTVSDSRTKLTDTSGGYLVSAVIYTTFAIIALGKLGGNELNYSSDVDLMYIYGDGEEPPKAPVSNREYFIRLAQHT